MRILIINLIFLLLTSCSQQKNIEGVIIKDWQGNYLHLNEYKGKWLILNFWASWCSPCRKEIPAFSSLVKDHSDKVKIIGINLDPTDLANMANLLKDFAINYPIAIEDPLKQLNFSIDYLPTTIFIDPTGIVRKLEVKEQTVETLLAGIGIN